MRIALYARVSKALVQNPENQYAPLLTWIKTAGHEQVKDAQGPHGIFMDEISSKDTRPKKEEVLKLMRLGQADGVAFVALDRWGRSMTELVLELEEFRETGKALISLKEGIDLSTAAGRLMANILATMANFERDRISERTMLGLARARAQGKRLGRPKTRCHACKALLTICVCPRCSLCKKLMSSCYCPSPKETPPANPAMIPSPNTE